MAPLLGLPPFKVDYHRRTVLISVGETFSQAFFYEILLMRDLIIHCPENRDAQLSQLRAAIENLPGDSSALVRVLGGGLEESLLN